MATVDGVPSCPQCGSARIWETVGSLTYVTCPVCEIAVESSLIPHIAPAPPVVLNGEEETELASAIQSGMGANTIHPQFDALDAVLAWFATNGITLTREARP